MAVVHYQIELYDLSVIRGVRDRLLAEERAARRGALGLSAAQAHALAEALTQTLDRAVEVPDEKIVHGRLAGVSPLSARLRAKAPRNGRKWSAAVKTHWQPPPGLFTQSASTIAAVVSRESDSLAQAMSRITFYENRAGKNLSRATRQKLEEVKARLRAHWR